MEDNTIECDDCDEAFTGRAAIRSYLREIASPGGTKHVCLRCLARAEQPKTVFLSAIPDAEWERVCGSQSREAFAALCADQGESAEQAWAAAVEHAAAL